MDRHNSNVLLKFDLTIVLGKLVAFCPPNLVACLQTVNTEKQKD